MFQGHEELRDTVTDATPASRHTHPVQRLVLAG
jgi:hypothetical protein